jgi:hypothetical protein
MAAATDPAIFGLPASPSSDLRPNPAQLATPAGFEPATTRLEGECSIQLSYGVGIIALGSGANAIIAEIIGITLELCGAFMRRDDRVVEPVFGREGNRLFHRLEM